jgi:UDP-glucose 4-epimerase
LVTGRAEDAEAAGFGEIVVGDIRDSDAITTVLSGADAVVHLAAQTGVPRSLEDPRFDLESNVVGTFELLEACRQHGVRRVVLASSAAPLGGAPPPASELVVPQPLSPYGASKLAMEAYASAYRASFGVETVVLRFSNVYGPYSYLKGSVVALWTKQLLRGETIRINGDGRQTRDFVHVDDICDAILLALEPGAEPGLYQLGTGVETSVIELARHMTALFGVDFDERVRFGPPLAAEVPRSYCDITKARNMLGYDPKRSIPEGLESTKVWFESIDPALLDRSG